MSGYAPEVGPDGRERPRYGEYATAEEQRSRIVQPEVTEALEAGLVAEPAAPAGSSPQPYSATAYSAPASLAPVFGASPAAPAKPRTADRIATMVLLAYGLFSVVTSVPSLFEYSGYSELLLGTLGVDVALSDLQGARVWGIGAAFVLMLGWVATMLISIRRLRTGRLTWWIPLVAGVVVNAVSAILALVPIVNDPAVWAALQAAVTGG